MNLLCERTLPSVNCKQSGANTLDQACRKSSLASRGCLVLAQQFGWIELQHPGDPFDRLQARIVAATLERADIGSIEPCLIGKRLLREPLLPLGPREDSGQKAGVCP